MYIYIHIYIYIHGAYVYIYNIYIYIYITHDVCFQVALVDTLTHPEKSRPYYHKIMALLMTHNRTARRIPQPGIEWRTVFKVSVRVVLPRQGGGHSTSPSMVINCLFHSLASLTVSWY